MSGSKKSGKKPVEAAGKKSARKAKLERVSRVTTKNKKPGKAPQGLEELYRAVMESTFFGFTLIDSDYTIVLTNKMQSKFFRKPASELIGKKCFREYEKRHSVCPHCPGTRAMATGQPAEVETEGVRDDGSRISAHIQAFPTFNADGEVAGFIEMVQDITESKRAEQDLKRERVKAQKYLDVAAVMMVVIDSKGRVGLINKKGCEILGYNEDEIIGKNWFDNFLPEGIRGEVKEVFDKVLSGQVGEPEYYENPVLTKNGEERLIAWHNTILRDNKGNVVATLSSGEDITKRKKAEIELIDYQAQLKSLASQLTLAEESERHRIATELHATVGQSLVISKMKLDELRASASSSEISKTLGEVCTLLAQTIQGARTLTFDLSSPVLYELGFDKAVAEWLNDQIENKHGIKTEFKSDGQKKPLDDDIRVFLFHDVRELLFNVVKHAQAKKVKVSIRKVKDRIQVIVEDDGVGFDPAEVVVKAVKTGSFGLFSIRERLGQLGGRLEIKSAPGYGAKITITVPLKREK